jgi:hypothetical protein
MDSVCDGAHGRKDFLQRSFYGQRLRRCVWAEVTFAGWGVAFYGQRLRRRALVEGLFARGVLWTASATVRMGGRMVYQGLTQPQETSSSHAASDAFQPHILTSWPSRRRPAAVMQAWPAYSLSKALAGQKCPSHVGLAPGRHFMRGHKRPAAAKPISGFRREPPALKPWPSRLPRTPVVNSGWARGS